jgi:hypothetical protein
MCLQVQAPAMNIPTDEQFFSKTEQGKPDIAFLKNHFYREGRLKEEHAMYIIEKATEVLHTEPNLLYVDAPVTGGFFPSPAPMIIFVCPAHAILIDPFLPQSVATSTANTYAFGPIVLSGPDH